MNHNESTKSVHEKANESEITMEDFLVRRRIRLAQQYQILLLRGLKVWDLEYV